MLSFSLISLIYFIYLSSPSFPPISLSFSLSLSLPLLPFLTLRPSYPVSLSPSLALPLSISLVPPSPASLPILPFHPHLSLSLCLFVSPSWPSSSLSLFPFRALPPLLPLSISCPSPFVSRLFLHYEKGRSCPRPPLFPLSYLFHHVPISLSVSLSLF